MVRVLNVLQLEDDDDDAALIAFSLEQVKGVSYRIRRVRTIKELRHFSDMTSIDVVLLDLHVPDSTGLDTLATAAQLLPGVPILALTSSGSEEMGIRTIELGAQDYVPKCEIMTPLLPRSIDFAIRRKELQRVTEANALTDGLTGLPNRTALERRLEEAAARARRQDVSFALAFIDLDGFKAVNDIHGHQAGDQVLAAVSHRLRAAARAEDFVGRLGGDEFVVLIDLVASQNAAQETASRYAGCITGPIEIKVDEKIVIVSVGASIGHALFPEDAQTIDKLISVADAAMYDKKRARKTTLRVVDQN